MFLLPMMLLYGQQKNTVEKLVLFMTKMRIIPYDCKVMLAQNQTHCHCDRESLRDRDSEQCRFETEKPKKCTKNKKKTTNEKSKKKSVKRNDKSECERKAQRKRHSYSFLAFCHYVCVVGAFVFPLQPNPYPHTAAY